MRIVDVIRESLADWGNNWIHFSKHPMLTVNPKGYHMDPMGIYFFPADHVPPQIMWTEMPYRYRVTISPDARILDVSHITPEQIQQLVTAAGLQAEYQQHIAQFPPKDIHKAFDQVWELLQRHYFLSHRRASFNAMLRSVGYQGIFDDTGAIHIVEPQLLVLDRRIITSVKMEQRKGTGYADMQKVMQELGQYCSQFGRVEIGPIRKPNKDTAYWQGRDNLLNGVVSVVHPQSSDDPRDYDRRYIDFSVYITKDHPDLIEISVRFANPQLGYGAGAQYSIPQQKWTWGSLDEKLRRPLETVMAPIPAEPAHPEAVQPTMAETKKMDSKIPQTKNRQNAGVNHSSGKMPGRVAGSGKAMKVKPGFVG